MLKVLNGAFVGKMRMADVGVGLSSRLLKQMQQLAFRKKARCKNRLGLDSKISINANNASLLDVAILLDNGIRDNGVLVPVRRTGEKINLDIKQKTLKELIDSVGLVIANSP